RALRARDRVRPPRARRRGHLPGVRRAPRQGREDRARAGAHEARRVGDRVHRGPGRLQDRAHSAPWASGLTMSEALRHRRTVTESETLPAWRQALSRDDIRELLVMRDWRSWLSVAVNWGMVAAAFALVARWPNPLTVVVALFVIGARQLGFAVLM